METNPKVLRWLIKSIDVALILIVVSVVATLFMTKNAVDLPYVSESSKKLLSQLRTMTFFSTFLMIASGIFYGIVLFQVRKIIQSILEDGVFQMNQVSMIKRISALYLILAGLALCFNLMLMVASMQNDNQFMLKASTMNLVSIFERFVLTGLIIMGVAQVFLTGAKIKEEQRLTI
ncbi:DUF2975 domain-containing protein [Pedobacter sp. KR3-3]|uniref:DUF2975 domain-containing protein n=1 Tax=Pedobacter albus TaxID=3113905 RepID=A0ABU7I5G1_9SPHI|nr:DUF2975 domain-containing protein [Pedobacter sp. KR3-3]MEE1944714.1 DUF2975 domain-containing protein [Pedobacter sp. KR3-3]